MADASLDDGAICLYPPQIGCVPRVGQPPVDGFTGSDHHNQAYEKFPVGTTIQVYDTTNKGPSYFTYLRAGVASGTAFAAKQVGTVGDVATAAWYRISNDGDQSITGGPPCVFLSAMTLNYYGWFWTGGVCPVDWVSGLDGNYETNDSVTAGCMISVGDMTADNLGFVIATALQRSCGVSTEADA